MKESSRKAKPQSKDAMRGEVATEPEKRLKYVQYVSRIAEADQRVGEEWKTFPPRQLTGKPKNYHCYIGRTKPEITCGREHRSYRTAEKCGVRTAVVANKQAKELR